MLPLSVLRTWFGGLVNWVILCAAVYAVWEWADGIDPVPPPRDERDLRTNDVTRETSRLNNLDRQGGWPYLAAGIAGLAFSFGGGLPVSFFLGQLGGPSPSRTVGKQKHIERPDGSSLFVQTLGPDDGPTLLFTHGWSLDSTVWSDVLERLGRTHRIVVWDLPGLGQSKAAQTRNFSLEKMAEDLAAVAEHAGRGPLILVGHSIGGMITQTFCRLHAKQLGTRVAGIVLLHTTYTNPLNTALGRTFWKAIELPILIPLNYLTVWLAPLAWLSNMQSYWNGTLHIATRIASFSGKQTWGQLNYGAWLAAKAWPGVIARGNLAMLAFDEQETLPHVDIPVLVIAGRHDRMTCPDASDRLARLVPHSIESAVDSGHLGFWEQPGEIAEIISEFVDRLEFNPPTKESSVRTSSSSRARAKSDTE
jgi:pimeloyl-ACP methyl ester carboxylesterase